MFTRILTYMDQAGTLIEHLQEADPKKIISENDLSHTKVITITIQ
jgi:hypothetical protein